MDHGQQTTPLHSQPSPQMQSSVSTPHQDSYHQPAGDSPGKLEAMLLQNIEWSKRIYEQNEQIAKRMLYMVIGNYLRLVILLVPIVLAIIYLPPRVQELLSVVRNFLEGPLQ